MINPILLKVRHQDKCQLKSNSELEDFKIYGNNDDQIIHIGTNLDLGDKDQLKHLME